MEEMHFFLKSNFHRYRYEVICFCIWADWNRLTNLTFYNWCGRKNIRLKKVKGRCRYRNCSLAFFSCFFLLFFFDNRRSLHILSIFFTVKSSHVSTSCRQVEFTENGNLFLKWSNRCIPESSNEQSHKPVQPDQLGTSW